MVWCCRYGVVLYCNSTDFEFTDYGMLHTSHTPTPSADFCCSQDELVWTVRYVKFLPTALCSVLVHLCEQHGHVCSKWVRMTPKDFLALLCQISSPPASSFQVKARLLCLLGKLFTDTACARTLALWPVFFLSWFLGFLLFFFLWFLDFSLCLADVLLSRLLSCFSIPSQLVSCQTRAGLPWLYMESWDSHACNCLHEASWPPCDQRENANHTNSHTFTILAETEALKLLKLPRKGTAPGKGIFRSGRWRGRILPSTLCYIHVQATLYAESLSRHHWLCHTCSGSSKPMNVGRCFPPKQRACLSGHDWTSEPLCGNCIDLIDENDGWSMFLCDSEHFSHLQESRSFTRLFMSFHVQIDQMHSKSLATAGTSLGPSPRYFWINSLPTSEVNHQKNQKNQKQIQKQNQSDAQCQSMPWGRDNSEKGCRSLTCDGLSDSTALETLEMFEMLEIKRTLDQKALQIWNRFRDSDALARRVFPVPGTPYRMTLAQAKALQGTFKQKHRHLSRYVTVNKTLD